MQGREVWLLKLAGVDSPEAADMLKGLRLLMRLRDRPALDSEDDFYVQDLVGMQVSSKPEEFSASCCGCKKASMCRTL